MTTLSRREFARLDGCSHTAVAQAIKACRLAASAAGQPFAADVGSGWRRRDRDRPGTCRTCGRCPTCGRKLPTNG